jgi:hypothetical protein
MTDGSVYVYLSHDGIGLSYTITPELGVNYNLSFMLPRAGSGTYTNDDISHVYANGHEAAFIGVIEVNFEHHTIIVNAKSIRTLSGNDLSVHNYNGTYKL